MQFMAKSLDSSGVFNQENYLGQIREVNLIEPAFKDTMLSHILEKSRAEGYNLTDLVLVNVVSRGSERNEPTEAILCEDANGKEGIIVKKRFSTPVGIAEEYRLYTPEGYCYIS